MNSPSGRTVWHGGLSLLLRRQAGAAGGRGGDAAAGGVFLIDPQNDFLGDVGFFVGVEDVVGADDLADLVSGELLHVLELGFALGEDEVEFFLGGEFLAGVAD